MSVFNKMWNFLVEWSCYMDTEGSRKTIASGQAVQPYTRVTYIFCEGSNGWSLAPNGTDVPFLIFFTKMLGLSIRPFRPRWSQHRGLWRGLLSSWSRVEQTWALSRCQVRYMWFWMQPLMFEYLSLLESVIDGSKVEKAGCNPRRKLGNMTWQASIPAISAAMLMEVDPSTNLNGAVLCHDCEHADTKDQSVSVLSLDTPIHWLLMRAYEQATKRFIEQARSCVTSILPRIGFAVLEEQTWQVSWAQMLSDLQGTKTFAWGYCYLSTGGCSAWNCKALLLQHTCSLRKSSEVLLLIPHSSIGMAASSTSDKFGHVLCLASMGHVANHPHNRMIILVSQAACTQLLERLRFYRYPHGRCVSRGQMNWHLLLEIWTHISSAGRVACTCSNDCQY